MGQDTEPTLVEKDVVRNVLRAGRVTDVEGMLAFVVAVVEENAAVHFRHILLVPNSMPVIVENHVNELHIRGIDISTGAAPGFVIPAIRTITAAIRIRIHDLDPPVPDPRTFYLQGRLFLLTDGGFIYDHALAGIRTNDDGSILCSIQRAKKGPGITPPAQPDCVAGLNLTVRALAQSSRQVPWRIQRSLTFRASLR